MTETYDDRYNKAESPTRYIKQRVADIAPTLDNNDGPSKKDTKIKPALWTSILAGGLAGVAVDFTLYPLDTIKTRLQSKQGFRCAGGFRKLYKGVVPILFTSGPLSALFFGVYNTVINSLRTENSYLNPYVYLVAAPAAELVSSVVRIPIEIVKQRKQISNKKALYIMKKTYREEGIKGFYRGYWSFVMRELPFAAIQYPLWEYMINQLIIYENGEELTALQTAICGAIAGAIAAVMTTPVDVIKTRIMLAEKRKIEKYKTSLNLNFAKEIYRDRGIYGFFAGVIPRTLWIMLGGFIYFGAYEKVKQMSEANQFFDSTLKKVQELSPTYVERDFENPPDSNEKKEDDKNAEKEKKETEENNQPSIRLNTQHQNIVDATLLQPSQNPERKE